MNQMKGIGVSPGISIGKARIFRKTKIAKSGTKLENDEAKKAECGKFDMAVMTSVNEINTIKKDRILSQQDIEILDTQIEFLTDIQIKSDVYDRIFNENKPAYEAVNDVISAAAEIFRNMDDEYLKERVADLEDAGNRILKNLNNSGLSLHLNFSENTIIIAEDLSPSETVTLDITKIAGFATQAGGKTSHSAIIAKAKGIPAVVACGDEILKIENNDIVILDGSTGDVLVNPGYEAIEAYKAKQIKISERLEFLKTLKDLPAKTTDDHQVNLYANIANDEDLEQVFDCGGEGVGLFRTEFLFLDRTSFPSEEEQFQFYKQVAIRSRRRPVTVRTIDIGGDKQLSYFGIPAETNPFLGYRAIRFCLDQKDIFLNQLKAILRASTYGNLKIMFPMICNVEEVRLAKDCVIQAKNELTLTGIKFDEKIPLGIMIEIPSAALMADILIKEVDFFSIGTNDLCQYTLAVDRMNEKVSDLYNHFNPGVLRLIQNVIKEGKKNNKPVGMCGEMASDPLATLLLIGMGLEQFSMGASSIPDIKNIIISNNLEKCEKICKTVMEMDNSDDIMRYLQEELM